MYFGRRFSKLYFRLIVDSRPQFLGSGPLPFGFQNALLQRAWTWRALATPLLALCSLDRVLLAFLPLEQFAQSLARNLPVSRLRPGILHRYAQARRQMFQGHSGRDLETSAFGHE